jgi:hypothetical protein
MRSSSVKRRDIRVIPLVFRIEIHPYTDENAFFDPFDAMIINGKNFPMRCGRGPIIDQLKLL